MIANRRSLLFLAVLACKVWAGSGDTAGASPRITMRVDVHGHIICSDIPLVSVAWSSLPPEQGFPCDADHLVVIRDYAAFLKAHPDLAADAVLREKGRHAFAFTITAAWPIYLYQLGPAPGHCGCF
jgi:hypothetical protein